MTIYVVKTCDGDVYYATSRVRNKMEAMDMAAEQVLQYDLSRYDSEDRELVRAAKEKQDWPALWEALLTAGAVSKVEVRT